MHSPDTPSTCLALSVGFPSPKGLDRVPTRVMTLWKSSRAGSTDNPVCARVPRARVEELAGNRAAQPSCGTGIPACPPVIAARIAAILFATILFAVAAAPAHAQIRKLVEENGRIVFVNADENNPVHA